MGAGKILMILGGLITIVATYFLTFYELLPGIYGWGIGAWLFVDDVFLSGAILLIIIEIFVIFLLIAGLLQLIGAKSRVIGFIGSFPNFSNYKNYLI